MDQENQAVETKVEVAATPQAGVEVNASAAPTDDPEAKLSALLEENDKLRRDRDNYRSATLVMKGKKEADELDLTDPVQLQAYIDKSVNDKLLETREVESSKELIDFAKSLARKNKELATSVANRSQIAPTSTGSGSTGMEVKSNSYWSPEQADTLKKRWVSQGIPNDRIEKMLVKAEENTRRT